MTHGTRAEYIHRGCRCEECKAANSRYNAGRRGEPMTSGPVAPRSWRQFAACKDTPVETFFPGTPRVPESTLAICRACEVREDCLSYAITQRVEDGVYGGMSWHERERYRVNERQRRYRRSLMEAS